MYERAAAVKLRLNWLQFGTTVPVGLVVRIRRSHRRGRGSIPRLGECVFNFGES